MEKLYIHKQVEPKISELWSKGADFSPKIDPSKKPFSIFLTPPNASGPMHIGNALMIAIQDILARYHRAKGEPTVWIPSTDHGGYETQVTFEKELEKTGKNKNDFEKKELFSEIGAFVEKNIRLIIDQIKGLGASVDWSRLRFTMDEQSLKSVNATFRKMVSDNLIYRRPYMVHYCPKCVTMLSDIELKEEQKASPLYFIKFFIEKSEDYITLATTRPEFLFAATHVLVHPKDGRYSHLIGTTIINPITNLPVEIVESKRKFDPLKAEAFLSPFSPSFDKYDYEYTLKNSLPSKNLLGWDGKMIERHTGLSPTEAREKEISFLSENGYIEKIENAFVDSTYLCKSGHTVENLITLTWFLKLDDEKTPLRKPALEAAQSGNLIVLPYWREKGLLEWLGKMPDWPIARQNVWGIKIPIWYEIADPSKFLVWFTDKNGVKRSGNLKKFLDSGLTLAEIEKNLDRIYAEEGVSWTLNKQPGKNYLPETDTFDTWFSSGDWSTMVFGTLDSADFKYFYPGHSIVIGQDLLRLSVCREIFLSLYVTGKLPFKIVYLHRLILGTDGRKMSKSLGNAISLDEYLEKYGADVMRMTLISYTSEQNDFMLQQDRIDFFKNFSARLWKIGRIVDLAIQNKVPMFRPEDLSEEDRDLLYGARSLAAPLSALLDKYSFAQAQERVCNALFHLEQYIGQMQTKKNIAVPLSVLQQVFEKYLVLLHPFMPFTTEELFQNLYRGNPPLASTAWPR